MGIFAGLLTGKQESEQPSTTPGLFRGIAAGVSGGLSKPPVVPQQTGREAALSLLKKAAGMAVQSIPVVAPVRGIFRGLLTSPKDELLQTVKQIGTVAKAAVPALKAAAPIVSATTRSPFLKGAADAYQMAQTPEQRAADIKKQQELGKEALGMGADIVRAVPRAISSVAIEPAARTVGLIKGKEVKPIFTPTTKVEKFLLGDKPIKGIFLQTTEAQQKAESKLKELGINPATASGMSLALAPIFVGSTTAMDLTPFGAEKKWGLKAESGVGILGTISILTQVDRL